MSMQKVYQNKTKQNKAEEVQENRWFINSLELGHWLYQLQVMLLIVFSYFH